MIVCSAECCAHSKAQGLLPTIRKEFSRGANLGVLEALIQKSFGSSAPVTEPDIRQSELRIVRTLVRIVKGLFFIETNTPLHPSRNVSVNLEPQLDSFGGIRGVMKQFEASRGARGRDLGDGVFGYRMVSARGHRCETQWMLLFFESLPFLCSC
jgi:hypothetical protein